jgi:hypothetical protein
MRGKGVHPGCWIEDTSGNKQANLNYTDRQFEFNATRPDGTGIFDASFSGQGIAQTLAEIDHNTHNLRLFDPNFPLPMLLLTVLVAVDTSA